MSYGASIFSKQHYIVSALDERIRNYSSVIKPRPHDDDDERIYFNVA